MSNVLTGSADLSPSTKTNIVGAGWFSPENRKGRNIHFGIREHAMAAICNGVALHGGLRIICSTFFTFSDYMKGAMRMSALMKLPVIYVFTHDSIGVGEDGPTHQPIEQLASLRAMPDINVWRPCDRSETVAAFVNAFSSKLPSAIVLSRQNLKQFNCGKNALNGAYVIGYSDKEAKVNIVSCGSEMEVCAKAAGVLKEKGIDVNLISMPCTQLFDSQGEDYKNILKNKFCVCVEASSDNIWYKYANGGKVLKMNSFGASAPMEQLFEKYGFTAENIINMIKGELS